MAHRILYNILQVFVVIAFAPLVEGVTSRLKEVVQSKRGPSVLQPYRDLWKLLRKDEIVSEESSWIFRAAPSVAFAAPVFVALLIPVLTRYPSSLLIAAVLIILAYWIANPILSAVDPPFARINLPLGLAAIFLGVFTVVVRREAVPQLLGLLALENGVFFAGIAIVPDLPVIAELAAAVDVPVVALVVGLLTRRIYTQLGTTSVGQLASLRERSGWDSRPS